eukprot:gene19700-27888_t
MGRRDSGGPGPDDDHIGLGREAAPQRQRHRRRHRSRSCQHGPAVEHGVRAFRFRNSCWDPAAALQQEHVGAGARIVHEIGSPPRGPSPRRIASLEQCKMKVSLERLHECVFAASDYILRSASLVYIHFKLCDAVGSGLPRQQGRVKAMGIHSGGLREGVALLQDGVTGELTAGQREVAQILHHNTLQLQGEIEALLRFNAAAFEARQLQRRDTDLLALLEAQVEAQRLQWQAKGLTVRIEGSPVRMPVDADKITSAVSNLLSNAIRFSPPQGTV